MPTVLLVEDDDFKARAVTRALKHHEVVRVGDFESALVVMDSVSIYAIVTDWDFPSRPGGNPVHGAGSGVVRRAQELGIRVAVFSGHPKPPEFPGAWLPQGNKVHEELCEAVDGL